MLGKEYFGIRESLVSIKSFRRVCKISKLVNLRNNKGVSMVGV